MKFECAKFVRSILPLLLTISAAFAQDKSRIAFKVGEPNLIPEGIAYDERKKTFHVGSTYLRKIISIDEKGAVKNFISEAQDGMRGVLGLRVDAKRRVLWAVSSDAGLAMPLKNNPRDCIGCSKVFKYDLDTGRLVKKYKRNLNWLCKFRKSNLPKPETICDSAAIIVSKKN